MKVKYASIFAIVLVLLSGIPLLSGVNYASAKYATNTQTQANNNECDTGTNCGITRPQTQGDGTANSPTNLQISKFNEEQEEVVGEPPVGGFPVTVENCLHVQLRLMCTVTSPESLRGTLTCELSPVPPSQPSLCIFQIPPPEFSCTLPRTTNEP